MKYIQLRWLSSRKLRRYQIRWVGLLMAMGLTCQIALNGGSSFAEPSAILLNEVSTIEYAIAAEPAAESPATVDSSKVSEADLLKSIPISQEPIKVSVGLHMSNLADVNQTSETFDAAGYLLYSWKDPRLAYKPQPNETSRSSSLDKIWHPALEMVNFKSSTNSDTFVEILPDGTVQAQERFAKTLSSALSLQKFPFDKQSLQVVLESLKHDERSVKLIADSPRISIGTDSFVSLSEWQIGTITGSESKSFFPPENQYYSRVTIQIQLTRNSGFYILKVMMPLLLITIASWSVFWIDPDEFATQIGIAFTNLLTVVALLLVINDTLPRVGYLTIIDGFTAICFTTILVAIMVLIIAHRSTRKENPDRAQKIYNLARWIVPTGFLLANLGLVAMAIFA
jgi:hypothetical protein